ncbi:NACHT domain-containing protein [Actinokineospora sp. NBRC 105648]|uniref:NACHT domain-containing protein n=1 Tax=Actinokineospora sp. NBRC 105648 TaxID=3032206 RepID=UPI0024A5900C|nr:NACHT domain-containing protein [Actinokineospora sp. NBRC 105648]GLZ38417.1 hypothetical protein Acsp05_20410 [Actinokineospora sp. NBRC 105648]
MEWWSDASAVLASVVGLALSLAMLWRGVRLRLKTRARRPVDPFGDQYRRFVLETLRYVDLKGLQTLSHTGLELDKVYVDVSLVPQAPQLVGTAVLGPLPATGSERARIEWFLDQPGHQVLAVLGGPGSGKTTLLRMTARQVCLGARVPVLLYLRDHTRAIVAGATMPELVRTRLDRHAADEPARWLDDKLVAGECVVMFDGLDEVARQEDRTSVSAWVERQVQQYPDNDFVLTSRRQGFLDAPVAGAKVLQVLPFTAEQVRAFVRGWYRVVAAPGSGESLDRALERSAADAEDLLTRLDAAPALADLTVNPLLLTMIATVHRFRGALPGTRADLYREICEVMLWHRQKAKNLPTGLASTHKLTLLRALAWRMMDAGVRQLSRAELTTEFSQLLRRLSTGMNAEEYLAEIVSDGLLVEWENGQFAFAHLTFQEYLAAAQVREKGLVDVLACAVDDIWWRETILLYTAASDADPIIRACLGSRSPTALSLAFECLGAGTEMAEGLRVSLAELIQSSVDGLGDRAQRRMVAAAMASRHLHDMVTTSGGTRVGREPAPEMLYRLYLVDAGRGGTPVLSRADAAVVPRAEVAGFLAWLAELTGVTGLRLPTAAEVETSADRWGTTHLAWSRAHASAEVVLWKPPGVDPDSVSTGEFIDTLREDFDSGVLARVLATCWYGLPEPPRPRVSDRLPWNRGGAAAQEAWGLLYDSAVTNTVISASTELTVFGAEPTAADLVNCDRGSVLCVPKALVRSGFLECWGIALTSAVLGEPNRHRAGFHDRVASEFATGAWLIDWTPEGVDLAHLPAILTAVHRTFLEQADHDWARTAGLRLNALARGPFAGGLVDADVAAKIRLLAVALARETTREVLQGYLMKIAVGITLLERRWAGATPMPTLVIAADAPEGLSARPPR